MSIYGRNISDVPLIVIFRYCHNWFAQGFHNCKWVACYWNFLECCAWNDCYAHKQTYNRDISFGTAQLASRIEFYWCRVCMSWPVTCTCWGSGSLPYATVYIYSNHSAPCANAAMWVCICIWQLRMYALFSEWNELLQLEAWYCMYVCTHIV